jgi:hypothetical protein
MNRWPAAPMIGRFSELDLYRCAARGVKNARWSCSAGLRSPGVGGAPGRSPLGCHAYGGRPRLLVAQKLTESRVGRVLQMVDKRAARVWQVKETGHNGQRRH